MSIITWRMLDADRQPTGPTNYLKFDAITVEEFSRSASVTQYPIETGATLSDHYQPLPREISLEAVVSDTPVEVGPPEEGMTDRAPFPTVTGYPKPMQSATAARREEGLTILRPVVSLPSKRLVRANIDRARFEIPFSAKVLWFLEPVTRIADISLALDELMEKRVPVATVLADGTEYANMMITNLVRPRVARSGGMVRFTIDLTEVVQAAAAEVDRSAQQREDHKQNQQKGTGGSKPVRAGSKEQQLDARTAAMIQAAARGQY